MFYQDVFDFMPELKKGDRADKYAVRYMGSRYPWFTYAYWDSKDPHVTEENSHIWVLTGLEEDLPLEMSEIFNMKAIKMGYSVTPGQRYEISTNLGEEALDTYDVSRDGRRVLAISKLGVGTHYAVFATNMVNYYTDHELLLEARRTLHLPELVPDSASISRKALREIDEILEKAEMGAFAEVKVD